jgi:hypothetical protein
VAIFIILAIGANALFRPTAVSHYFKSIIPNIHQIISINVSLHKTPVDIRTSRYTTA